MNFRPPKEYILKDYDLFTVEIQINPIYEKTKDVFDWISKLYQISRNSDPAFDHENEINKLLMKKENI